MPTSPDFVATLLDDAKHVAVYFRHFGPLPDTSLHEAIAAVERPPKKDASDPSVLLLEKAVQDATRDLPPETRAAIFPSRGVLGSRWSATRLARALVVTLSILVIAVTGRLTYVHNQGVAISQELESLALVDPGRALRDLVWDMAQTSARLRDDGADLAPADFDLALNAREGIRAEIAVLSERVSSIWSRTTFFLDRQSVFPIWGMRLAHCAVLVRLDRSLDASGCSGGARPFAVDMSVPPQSYDLCMQGLGQGGGATFVRDAPAASGPLTASDRYDIETREVRQELFCRQDLTINLDRFPQVGAMTPHVNEKVELYAFWLLPALYGVMGAILFQLRRMLDPTQPSPSLVRFLNRLILAGFSGIVLGWFFAPESRLSTNLVDIGFGLFVLAFVAGYSLNVVFAMLDRLVSLTETGIQRFGDARTGPRAA